jgi:N4-gp56 family major capsid protein
MAAANTYGDLTPRMAAYSVAKFLARAQPMLNIEKFGQTPTVIPTRSTKVAKFRRYFLQGALGAAGDGNPANAYTNVLSLTPLTEGVTPAGKKLTFQDYTVTLVQLGDYAPLTDVIDMTHEDNVLAQLMEVMAESAAQTLETYRYNVLKAGVNVFYANGTARTAVNTVITLALQRQITTGLVRQNAKMITQVVKSTVQFRTEPIEAAFIALVHPDLETDIRNMTGFINTKQYGTVTPWENEIGSVERVRYLTSTIYAPFPDAGGAKGAMRSTSGTSADVYPILYLGRDAYGIVSLKGDQSITPMVVNPKPAAGDPLGQRGTVAWKTMTGITILNDCYMGRAETAATA